MGSWTKHLRFAGREVLRQPQVSLTVTLSLALPFAAATAVFAASDSLVLRALPFEEPDRLAMVWLDDREREQPRTRVAWADFVEWREGVRGFDELAAYHPALITLTGDHEPELVAGAGVTASFFSVLGVQPVMGRVWTAEEQAPGGEPLVLLGDGLWRRRFAADPGIVGRRITLDSGPATVLGVLPPELDHPEDAELWMPPALLADEYLRTARDARLFEVVGRLADGVEPASAQEELTVLLARTAEQHPAVYEDHGIRLEPLPEVLLGDVRRVLALLSLAAAVLVAIAASNAIHLLLARAVDRQRDFALRSALGAGRRRLAAQLFVEGTLLGIGAAAAGLLIAATALRAIDRAFPLLFPAARTPAVDLVEIAFAAVLAGLVGLLLGAAALARTRRVDLAAELRESGPVGTASPRGGALRRLLVATEVTLATSLGICGLLLVLSAHRVAITEPGFEPHRLLTFQISLPYSSYPEQQDEAAFFQRALDRLSAAPEVVSAAASSSLAFGRAPTLMPFAVEGMPRSADRGPFLVIQEAVTGGFFATLGIDVVAGRSFAAGDDGSAAPVALINRTAARRFFGDADPIGRRIAYWDPLFGDDPPDAVVVWRRVVGIVADSRRHSLDAPPQTEVFVPFAQSVRRTMRFVVRTSGDPLAFAPSARRAIWALDGSLPITDLRTQHQIHRDASSGRRFLALLVSILAGLGIALAAVGTYAVVSFAVRRSVRELGVRLAVGADRPDLLRHVLLHHGAAPAAGLAVGLAGGWMASRSVTAYLYQVDAAEPSAFASGLVLVGTAIALACLLPARRAARLDPLRVLRDS